MDPVKHSGERRRLATSPFRDRVGSPAAVFAVADRVTHDRYGMGTVIGVEAGAVLVDFRSSTERLVTPCAKLRRL